MTPLREQALAAIEARLRAALPDVTVERSRRTAVDIDTERLPRLIVAEDGWQPDASQDPASLFASLGVVVQGVVAAATDLACEQALTALHARVVAALAGYTPPAEGLADIAEESAEFDIFPAADSSRAGGEFAARFTQHVIALEWS